MVNKWKSRNEISIPEEIRVIPPLVLIDRYRNFCIERSVPQTYINKNISKIKNKLCYRIVYDAIEQLKVFDMNQLIKKIGGVGITDNVLQRKVLAHMSCMGIVKVDTETFVKPNKKMGIKFVYTFVPENERVECKYLIKNKCGFDWKQGKKIRIDLKEEE